MSEYDLAPLVADFILATECADCERCTWNPGPDCKREDHEHCEVCGHCMGRHRGTREPGPVESRRPFR